MQMAAAVTRRGELTALVDTFDSLDVASAVAAGVDLERLLWVRSSTGAQSGDGSLVERAVDRALKALNLVLQSGGFALVALDLADAPVPALKRLPFTTWLRVQRTIEGSDTACVLIAPEPVARSAGGLTLMLEGKPTWADSVDRNASTALLGALRNRRLTGIDVGVRIISSRRGIDAECRVRCAAPGLHDENSLSRRAGSAEPAKNGDAGPPHRR
jgi:hypothetical protein